MDGKAMASALLTSFNALVAVATPDRVVPVLRHALTTLLAEEPTPKPSKKNRTRWTGNIEAWTPLREQVLTRLAARQMTRRELAAELGIAHATLKPSLSPRGPVPSKANMTRLQRWLDALEGAADNGHAREAAATAYRLTAAERERLAAYRALEESEPCAIKSGSPAKSSTRPWPGSIWPQRSSPIVRVSGRTPAAGVDMTHTAPAVARGALLRV